MVDVPEIKLIRKDTTLELSQKAEKVYFRNIKSIDILCDRIELI